MRIELEPSFVLHQRPYRETSQLVEIFGERSGRVALVARGARRSRSPQRGLLQPFSPLLLSWVGRGELGTLTGAEIETPGPPLPEIALFSALYLNELLMRLLHRHDPHPSLFSSYQRAVDELRAGEPVELALRIFEKNLLQEIGYGLVLDYDADSGERITAQRSYRYRLERGPVEDRSSALDGIPVSGRTLLALASGRLEGPDEIGEAKRLMRYLLDPLLGERPLATRSLFRRNPAGSS